MLNENLLYSRFIIDRQRKLGQFKHLYSISIQSESSTFEYYQYYQHLLNHGPLHDLARRSPSTSARIRSLIYLHRSIRWSAKHHWRSGCQPLRCRFNFRHFGLRCNPRTASAGASYLPQLSYVDLQWRFILCNCGL